MNQINTPDPVTGETALFFAAKSGKVAMVTDLLERGANPNIRAKDQCTVLHWLFMFPTHLIRQVGQKICQRLLPDDQTALFSQGTTGSRVLDSQFPLELRGTALSFAVASASNEAVHLLLDLGADPMCLTAIPSFLSRHVCPLFLAASLHLDHMFAQMVQRIPERPNLASNGIPEASVLLALSESFPLERELIHGSRAEKACRETVRSVARYFEAFENAEDIIASLEATVAAADTAVAGRNTGCVSNIWR